MAIFSVDFSEYTVDATPSDFDCYWGSAAGSGDSLWKVRSDAGSTGGAALRFNESETTTAGAGDKLAIWTTVPDSAHQRALIKWSPLATTIPSGVDTRPYMRAASTTTNKTGYTLGVREPDLDINKFLSDAFTNLASDTVTGYSPVVGTWYRTEVEVNGSTLRVRTWEEGQPAPSTWLEDTDSDITSGGFGLLTFNTAPMAFDWITVTTAGETPTPPGSASPILRKGGTFDVETTLGDSVTTATLDGEAITVDSQTGTTVTLEDTDGSITTSGEYDVVLDDGTDTETITVQVNVYGVVPSENPVQKDGDALASLTGVQVRVTDGVNINGTQLYYSGAATTDASGNLGKIDLSSTTAAVDDSVLLHMLTAAGDSIIAAETVELI